MVSNNASGTAVNRQRIDLSGGSSSVLRNALLAWDIILSASTMTPNFQAPSLDFIRRDSSSWRICSTRMRRDFDSGSNK
jgi:hypothetical protein